MKRIGLICGLVLLMAGQVFTQGAGLIIIHDPDRPGTEVFPPRWPHPHPPHWQPRPIHRFTALEVRSLQANAKIRQQVAETKIEQEFYNPNPRQLEGTFILPLPKGAHLKNFRMEVNGKMMDAELLSAEKAKRTYEEIVRQVKDPALLEYVGQDLLKVRIFPIEPHSTKRVELSYSQVLEADAGVVGYRLPLNVAKYCAQPIGSFSLKLDLETPTPLKTLYSPSHQVEVVRHGAKSATIGLEQKQVLPDQDFQFFYSAEPRELGMSFLAYKKEGEPGYFLLIASPGVEGGKEKVVPKDVVFVLDTSGSMAGEKIEQAKKSLLYCVNSLNEEDRFEVMRFSTEAEQLFKEARPVTSENRKKAVEFVEGMKAVGGTAINDALEKALALRPEKSSRPYVIVFLTDGQPTVGVTKEDQILQNVKSRNKELTRIFCFGLGTDVNTHLLDKIAEETSAISQYVLPSEDIEIKVSSFFAKINEPVLAGVELDFGAMHTKQVHPGRLPDLFKGQQLTILGRYDDGGKSTAKLTGKVGEEEKKFSYTLEFPEEATEHDFIPRLWATRRVGYLLDEIRLHGKSKELEEEVTELARQYGIVTPYTSYLIVEDQPQRFTSGAMPAGRLNEADHYDPMAFYRQNPDLMRRYFPHLQSGGPAGGDPEFRRYGTLPQQPASAGSQPQVALRAQPTPKPELKSGDSAVLNSRYGLALKSADTVSSLGRAEEELVRQRVVGANLNTGLQEMGVRQGKFIGGRMFYKEGEMWLDSSISKFAPDAKPIQVEFDSKEYYELLKQNPQAREFLSLGTRIKFVLNGKLYEIVPASRQAQP